MTNFKKILVATANPDDSGQVRTDRFISSIQKGLQDAEKSDVYNVIPVLATDLGNFANSLEKHKPHILVLVGHGDRLDRFVFETQDGEREFAKPIPFANTLGLYSETLESVLVMSCHSQSLAKEITKHIAYAVGYEEELLVKVAKEYVEKFFFYLANGNDYELTNRKARTVMQNKIHENQMPVLFQNPSKKVISKGVEQTEATKQDNETLKDLGTIHIGDKVGRDKIEKQFNIKGNYYEKDR